MMSFLFRSINIKENIQNKSHIMGFKII